MNVEELRIKQVLFEGNRLELQKDVKKLEKLRLEFVNKFSLEKLKNVPIEKYVVGHGNKDTFCYWLETKLIPLGKIKGGSTADKKFGVYFSKDDEEYKTIPKWGKDGISAYQNILKRISELLEAGKIKDLDTIKKSPISPMFKGKILATYYPDDYLSIFSGEHLDYFIKHLGIEEKGLDDEIDKREHILQFKNKDNIMKHWSMYEFGNFMYAQIGSPIDKKYLTGNIAELKEYIDEDYADFSKVEPSFIELEIDELSDTKEASISGETTKKKVDFDKENRRNKRLGDRGERIVLFEEKNYLKNKGKDNLAKKVEQVSKTNDSLGYDILSFEIDGSERYIEVKSTKSKIGMTNFLISENQLRKSKVKKNYYIYVVFEASKEKPTIWRIKNPFELPENKVKITPVSYRVAIKPKV